MSYRTLYDRVQTQGERISTRWLKEEAIKLSSIDRIKEQWSGVIDGQAIRGFYVEGPMGPPVPVAAREALIVLARSMCTGPLGNHWRRFIYTKELMHVFDEPDEKTDTAEKFDTQTERFRDPAAPMCPQFRAEQKAFFRALGVLCTQEQRFMYREKIGRGEISIEVVAAALRLPVVYVRELILPNFEVHLEGSK